MNKQSESFCMYLHKCKDIKWVIYVYLGSNIIARHFYFNCSITAISITKKWINSGFLPYNCYIRISNYVHNMNCNKFWKSLHLLNIIMIINIKIKGWIIFMHNFFNWIFSLSLLSKTNAKIIILWYIFDIIILRLLLIWGLDMRKIMNQNWISHRIFCETKTVRSHNQ